ncbi:Oidioi.mRNA.OKI2018_I69.chr1.g3557.t1.cds [Oikopleura dioica]|uniref:Oidioi.mRNA.OKI2018_I69.chr1.g3557.t1.cds n=1 Tax=Oikopleura dioica TaxID=34765 RepID=A0ABN7SYT4_OIKDI|nr:Oidioi.mRNA.OKI2018_I69.chr1.g3557.t1.cds [Oikopleura dioica]
MDKIKNESVVSERQTKKVTKEKMLATTIKINPDVQRSMGETWITMDWEPRCAFSYDLQETADGKWINTDANYQFTVVLKPFAYIQSKQQMLMCCANETCVGLESLQIFRPSAVIVADEKEVTKNFKISKKEAPSFCNSAYPLDPEEAGLHEQQHVHNCVPMEIEDQAEKIFQGNIVIAASENKDEPIVAIKRTAEVIRQKFWRWQPNLDMATYIEYFEKERSKNFADNFSRVLQI